MKKRITSKYIIQYIVLQNISQFCINSINIVVSFLN